MVSRGHGNDFRSPHYLDLVYNPPARPRGSVFFFLYPRITSRVEPMIQNPNSHS